MKTSEKTRMLKHTPPPKSAQPGFTLIELMVTVAIVAILATIAATSYTSQIQKSRRTDARSAVLDLAGREEKLFSTTNAYSQTATQLGYAAWGPIGSNYYNLSVVSPDPAQAAGTQPNYLITATAINAQTADTACTTLSVDQTGKQTYTGTAPNAATCWGN
ncbi:MAG: type IV pilin protein [Gammaproteobacteria bacterium]